MKAETSVTQEDVHMMPRYAGCPSAGIQVCLWIPA